MASVVKRIERLHVPTSKRCNNKCIFCMEFPRSTTIVPDDETLRRQIAANVDSGVILFTAGEPTLNPALADRMSMAKEAGYNTICLITNGRLLEDRDFCVRLLEAGMNDVTVSIHGHTPALHDSQTGVPGSFEQVWRAVNNLIELGNDYVFKLSFSTVINKINLPYLKDILKSFISLDEDIVFSLRSLRLERRALENIEKIIVPLTEAAAVLKDSLNSLMTEVPGFSESKRVTVAGIPFCLMKGYEAFIGADEVVLGLFDSSNKTMRIENMANTSKHSDCMKCAYDSVCYGIDQKYVERYGWDGIEPMMERSPDFGRSAENALSRQKVRIKMRKDISSEERNSLCTELVCLRNKSNSIGAAPASIKADLYYEIGLRHLMLDHLKQAAHYFILAVEHEPGHGGAHLKKSIAFAAMGKKDAANTSLGEAVKFCKDPASLREIKRLRRLLIGN